MLGERRSVPPQANRAPSPGPGDGKPWVDLRRYGLRVEPGLHLYGAGVSSIEVSFEPPVQLNNARMHVYRGVTIGRYSFLRSGTMRHVGAIGRYTSIGPGVILGEGEHPIDWLTTTPTVFDRHRWFFYPPANNEAPDLVIPRTDQNTDPATRGLITIGNDVWIGANVIVRRGITIGDGAVVAAGAFVNRDVAPYTIVGGLPAKLIRPRFPRPLVDRLLASRWWEFDLRDFAGLPFDHPGEALDRIQSLEESGAASRIPLSYNTVRLTRHGHTGLIIHENNRPAEEP
jgi:acetyltransferase-like isoleucine patch superfamily enzyme